MFVRSTSALNSMKKTNQRYIYLALGFCVLVLASNK